MSSPVTKMKKIVVIGSGPTGLGAAWRLQELQNMGVTGFEWELHEASPTAGGLAMSVVDDQGFTWDMGGHVIFSHYAYFTELVEHCMDYKYTELQREAWCWMENQFIPYPFQNNIHRLSEEKLLKCITGLRAVEGKVYKTKPKNFLEWLSRGFGAGIMEVFLTPYNRKVWAYDPSEMNVEWMGERVATVDFDKVMQAVVSKKDALGWGPNNIFRFPLHGGTGSIWKRLYELLPQDKIKHNSKVISVNATAKELTLASGETLQYTHLVSTMPLDQLCQQLIGTKFTPQELKLKANKMKYSSSHIIGFGIEGQVPENLKTKCWMYFSEDNCPFYRVTVFSNYSPNHVPKVGQQWSLMCEVSESAGKPVDFDQILQQAEQGCLNTKLLLPEHKVVSRFHKRLEHGYPTPFFGRDELMVPIFDELEQHNILSRGRFGAWKYEVSNQDHSMMQGVEAVDHCLFGTPENTFRNPGLVNRSPKHGRHPTLPAKQEEETKTSA